MTYASDPAAWRKLERAIEARAYSRDCELTANGRALIVRVVRRLGAGGAFPSREDLAAELGLGRASLRTAINELAGAGLIRLEDRGSRPDAWELDTVRAERWAAGELHLWGENRPTSEADSAPQTARNRTTNEPAPSIRPPDGDRAPAPPRAREESPGELLDRHARACRRALRDAGFDRPSNADEAELREWLAAGVPLEDVLYAIRQANHHRARNLAYVAHILDRLQDERPALAAAEPVALDAYRTRTGA